MKFSKCLWHVEHGHRLEGTVFVTEQRTKLRLANTRGVRQHGLEHWLKFTGRTANNFEHVGGGGLSLKRLTQFVEQPRVLDGDDCLCGEILNQFDLLVGERTHFLTVDTEDTYKLIPLKQRYKESCTSACING